MIPVQEEISMEDLESRVLCEFRLAEAEYGDALTYWPPDSMDFATGIKTPLYPQSCCPSISCPPRSYPPISCPQNICPSIFYTSKLMCCLQQTNFPTITFRSIQG
ncbi:hypothetical protein Bca4012_036704 [Brassica carinata]